MRFTSIEQFVKNAEQDARWKELRTAHKEQHKIEFITTEELRRRLHGGKKM